MNKLPLALSILIAAGFFFFGLQKFGATNPIFSVIAERSGISLFEPYVRVMTGIAEIVTGVMLLIPRTRLLGAIAGIGVLAGAISFHISPWLGINVPGIGPGLFFTALVMLLSIIVLVFSLKKQGYSLFGQSI